MSRENIHNPPILELGPDFYDPVKPAVFPEAHLRYRNQEAARFIGLDSLSDSAWKDHFWAFKPLPGNLSEPLALRYHGHQFMHYNHELGDGRGFLFAQFPVAGTWYDLGTKGSGQTPYSRDGDGRLTLKGAYREALATELLQSLGVNTSKTFSFFETGENLVRYDEPSPTRAAVLVRFSHGHIRIGTFQRLAHFEQKENIQKLVDVCLKAYYPEIHSDDADERAFLFFQAVVRKCALLTAQWMIAGFVHGVLNTDNINITGESFDYGPYRFLPSYDVRFTAAYFDRQGLYSFGRQPVTMLWNLQRLGETLKLQFNTLPVEEIIEEFSDEFNAHVKRLFLQRLNLKSRGTEADGSLLTAYFNFMESSPALYEQAFFDFFGGKASPRIASSPQKDFYQGEEFANLMNQLQDFEVDDVTKMAHSYFQNSKPCTLLIEEIESIWKPIAEENDWGFFYKKLEEIRSFRGIY
ncbi:protein adenylyltransferase SelO family protein [Bdellovibrio sp. HCB337]|uniref:protein adenylyltransferase SelO family protein n=1 Tax=Bdellovibrio sp. HCB337 TaxID=3394358 RepID=UPI0039A6CA0C